MAARSRTFSLKLLRSRSLSNFRRPRRHFERALSLEQSRPASILGRPDAPGVDFGGRNSSIFELLWCSRAFAAYFARSQQNIVKTDTKRISKPSRRDTKTTKNRSASTFDGPRCFTRARTPLRDGPGASWDRPGDALRLFLSALGPSGASQDESQAGFLASWNCPQHVPIRP